MSRLMGAAKAMEYDHSGAELKYALKVVSDLRSITKNSGFPFWDIIMDDMYSIRSPRRDVIKPPKKMLISASDVQP